jgi:hypothetical protein
MSDLSFGNFANVVLNPGQILRVGTGGVATVLMNYGGPAGTTVLTAQTQDFGPYDVPAKLRVTATSGVVSYGVRDDVGSLTTAEAAAVLALVSGPGNVVVPAGQFQINYSSYGNSLADLGPTVFDLRQVPTGNISLVPHRAGPWIIGLSNGLFRVVGNGGVSGNSTTSMLTREGAGASSTRKNIADILSVGTNIVQCHLFENNVASLSAGASYSSIVSAAIADALVILKRFRAGGAYPIVVSNCGYAAGSSAAENATRIACLNAIDDQMKVLILAANGALGSFVDVRAKLRNSLGASLPGYDLNDGNNIHPSAAAMKVVVRAVLAEALSVLRRSSVPPTEAYPYYGYVNQIANPDFSASAGAAGSNLATGVTVTANAAGTGNTVVNNVIEWRGQNWQEVIFTPGTEDASATTASYPGGNTNPGNWGFNITIDLPIAGLTAADVLGGEFSVYIDDGAGGPPNMFRWLARCRNNAVYSDCPGTGVLTSYKNNEMEVIDQRQVMIPFVSPGATFTPSHLILSVYSCLANNPNKSPIRARVSLPRVLILGATY